MYGISATVREAQGGWGELNIRCGPCEKQRDYPSQRCS